jgi:glycyl-tRNA synthetase (class II)
MFSYIKHIKYLSDQSENEEHLMSLFPMTGKSATNFLLKQTKQIVITQTTCQNVLENILYDSVQYRRDKSEIIKELKPEAKKKIVFRLDFKLAPFKACILYNSNSKNDDMESSFSKLAYDLKKMFLYNQINVILLKINSESELESKYDHLDEMGIPYSIYLPSNISENGTCFIRNRETTLIEHLNFGLVVKQFCAIAKALNY